MGSVARPYRLEIQIDEWQAAQEKVEAVGVDFSWRGADNDPVLAALFAGFPAGKRFVRLNLLDGRTTLAPEGWKGVRFGKGRTIYEAARRNFEAWSGGRSFLEEARRSEVGKMVRRLVPDFDSYTDKEQVDFLVRTQNKIDAVKQSADELFAHLEYATPDKRAIPPRKVLPLKVRAAVFSDMLRSTRRAGEILDVAQKDMARSENQTIRKMAKYGRTLLHDYYGEAEYDAIIDRMQRYNHWWTWFMTIEDPKEQMYVLLAEAQGTSTDHEKRLASEDGFAEKLDEWVNVVERRLEAEKFVQRSEDPAQWDDPQQLAHQLWHRQRAIEETDTRFETALSLAALKTPPPSVA